MTVPRASRLIIAAWLLCAPCALFAADHIAVARDFLSVIYPELNGKRYHVRVSLDYFFDTPVAEFMQFGYIVERSDWVSFAEGKPGLISKYQPVVTAHFEFNPVGLINRFSCTTDITNPTKAESFSQLMDQHPEWTVDQIGNEMTKAGAHYGPSARDKLLNALPLSSLETFFGKLSVTDFRFDLRYDPDEKGIMGTMTWLPTTTVRTKTKKDLTYIFSFEPFEGRLLRLGKDPIDFSDGSNTPARK